MGDDQQARKAEAELLKGLSQDCESDDKPTAKKPHLLKRLTKKTAVSKPKNRSRQKKSQPRGKKSDFSLDLGSLAKKDINQQPERSDQPQSSQSDHSKTEQSQSSHGDQW